MRGPKPRSSHTRNARRASTSAQAWSARRRTRYSSARARGREFGVGTRRGRRPRFGRVNAADARRHLEDARVLATADELAKSTAAEGEALRSTVLRGSAWSIGAYAGSQALRFGGNLLLTRLLLPEAFGAMALVTALLQGLQLFSDIGIGPSIIHSPRGNDREFLNTAWTLQVLRGALLWLAACAAAVPFAALYDAPLFAWILPISGLSALIAGFNSTRLFTMYRNVDLGRVSALEFGSQAAGIVVMLAWTALDRSIWALVAGGLAGSLARLVLSHTLLDGVSNRLRWDKSALGPILHFGRWIFISTLLTFLVEQSDRLIFGKLVPIAVLGIYSVAWMIAMLPAIALSRVGSSVFFPVLSRVANAGGDLAAVFRRVRRPWLILGGWMIAGLGGGGSAAVQLLYDERYAQAGWIVQVLALGSWFAILEATNGAALLARGQAKWTAASSLGKLAGMIALIPLGFHWLGFPGAVLGLAVSDALKYAVSAFAIGRVQLRTWPDDLRLSAWVGASAALGWVLSEWVQRAGGPRLLVAATVFVVVTLAWLPLGVPLLNPRSAPARAGA
ncbi:MAG: polysaccharide biosynthesis protein [Planctomycetota bacterium]|nr:MAG: polysaccharide biosynthesis protein [Planctomycetota bacterium]